MSDSGSVTDAKRERYEATMKRLPTDEQIFELGYEDAGDFCLRLKDASPADYQEFMEVSAREFDDHAPLPQPNFRLVDHMCCFLVKSHEELSKAKKAKKGGGGGKDKD